MKKFISVIIIFLLCAAIVVGGVYLAKSSDDNPDKGNEQKQFSVYNDAGERLGNNSKLWLEDDKEYTFTVANGKDYNVAVVINTSEPASNFSFNVNGLSYNFRNLGDLTQYFEITKTDNSFTLSIEEDLSVLTVLEKIFDGEAIELDEQQEEVFQKENKRYFSLKISSQDNEDVIYVNFGVITGLHVELPEELIF